MFLRYFRKILKHRTINRTTVSNRLLTDTFQTLSVWENSVFKLLFKILNVTPYLLKISWSCLINRRKYQFLRTVTHGTSSPSKMSSLTTHKGPSSRTKGAGWRNKHNDIKHWPIFSCSCRDHTSVFHIDLICHEDTCNQHGSLTSSSFFTKPWYDLFLLYYSYIWKWC